MSKKKSKQKVNSLHYEGDNDITNVDIAVNVKTNMLINGANVNFMRQVPDIRDGLKPVERRILYGMFKMDLRPSRPAYKSARIVGEVMAKFHPHGDGAIYDVLVRLAQDWNMYIPLTEDTGNFGTQYKSGGAAMRYTVTKLTQFAWDCYFSDFDKDCIFMRSSYDGKEEEPEYLPSKYPVALILGSMGIASGYRVDIPQYNTTEVLQLAIDVIEGNMIEPILPDSVTYCDVVDTEAMRGIFSNFNGTVRYRGKVVPDYTKNTVYVYAPPIRVYLDKINKSITENLVETGVIKGMVNSRRFVVNDNGAQFDGWEYTFRKDIDLDEVCRLIYKRTRMDDTIPVNLLFLDDFKEVQYSVIDYVRDWVELRREYKHVRYTKLLRKCYEQIHTIETILMVFSGDNGPKVVKMMQSIKKSEAQMYLMDEFGVSSLQARTITNMSIGDFTTDSMQAFKERLPVLRKEQKRIQKALAGSSITDREIIDELKEGIVKYGEPRRSKIIENPNEDVVPNTDHLLVVTKKGFIKKLDAARPEVGNISDGDVPIDILVINNRDDILVVDDAGYIHRLKVSKIPSTDMESPGLAIGDYVKMRGNICSIVAKPNLEFIKDNPDSHILMVSKDGTIKKSLMSDFASIKTSVICMNLDAGDKIVMVKVADEELDEDILVYTELGMGVRYPYSEVKVTGRGSKGIKALASIDEGDQVAGISIIDEDHKFLLCVTDKGKVKKCELKYFRTMKRDSKPLKVITLDDKESICDIRSVKGKESFMVFLRNTSEELKIKDVTVVPRLGKAIKMIPVRRGDNIISIRERK